MIAAYDADLSSMSIHLETKASLRTLVSEPTKLVSIFCSYPYTHHRVCKMPDCPPTLGGGGSGGTVLYL